MILLNPTRKIFALLRLDNFSVSGWTVDAYQSMAYSVDFNFYCSQEDLSSPRALSMVSPAFHLSFNLSPSS